MISDLGTPCFSISSSTKGSHCLNGPFSVRYTAVRTGASHFVSFAIVISRAALSSRNTTFEDIETSSTAIPMPSTERSGAQPFADNRTAKMCSSPLLSTTMRSMSTSARFPSTHGAAQNLHSNSSQCNASFWCSGSSE